MSAISVFFESLSLVQRHLFPDLYFRGHRSASALCVDTGGAECMQIRIRSAVECLHLERIELLGRMPDGKAKDLSSLCEISCSSVYPGTEQLVAERKLFAEVPQGVGIHTNAGRDEWICLTFDEPQRVEQIRVHNRDDEWASRAWTLLIEISDRDGEWRTIYSQTERARECAQLIERSLVFRDFENKARRILGSCLKILTAIGNRDLATAKDILNAEIPEANRDEVRQGFSQTVLNEYCLTWNDHGITRPFKHWSSNQKAAYLEQALQVSEKLRSISSHVSFGFGFVLGLVRDGDLIEHDDDVDLIVAFDRKQVPTLTAALAKVEAHLLESGFEVKGRHFSHRWVAKKGWLRVVDVFVGLQEGAQVSWFPSARGNLLFDDVFPVLEVDLHGLACPVPRNPIKYLDVVYGPSWRQSDAKFRHPWNRRQFADIA